MEGTVEIGGNRLLQALDPETRASLTRHLARVDLGLRDYVYHANQPIEHVYFPIDGVVSMIADVESSSPVEVATVGNEGMAGLPLFLGTTRTPGDAFSQIPGGALRMSAQSFTELTRRSAPFAQLMRRFTQAMFVQISQNSACNRAHSIDERCARWLLMTHDRVRRDDFTLTQEFLGQMLGVRRASVNTVAALFQHAGFITYSRGRLRILDRQGLEAASCNCYAIIRSEYDDMLNGPAP